MTAQWRMYLAMALMVSMWGCATTAVVAPYERGHLAEQGMQWQPNSRNEKLKGHVYTSKEASSGGTGAAGGGCGCN